MCLYNNTKSVEKILKDNPAVFTAYKVLRCDNGKLISPFRSTIWKSGINKSSSKTKKPSTMPIINKGIHVLISEKVAIKYKKDFCFSNNKVIVGVTCRKKHLIGANLNDKQMVFSEVFLSKKEYNRVMKCFLVDKI